MITIGAMPMASKATTAVELNRSRVPEPVINLGLISEVSPMVKTKITSRLNSRFLKLSANLFIS
jgi:hypothetical protein